MEEKIKSEAQLLKERLIFEPVNGSKKLDQKDIEKSFSFCDGYKDFLNCVKTERETISYILEAAKKKGFTEFKTNTQYKKGDKIYYTNRNKTFILTTIGEKPLCDGIKIVVSHIDAPRLDLKQRPLYEEAQLAYFKTHYYGGIKKYQWTALPLALHGVIVKADGTTIQVTIGEDINDPVFCITDLLPHLATEQMKRTLADGVRGEELNILIGSLQFKDDKQSELVKLNIIKLLNEKYGIIEADFLSAELEAVPLLPARDVGFDRSIVGAYGQDDRVCVYTSLIAALECENPTNTVVTVFADKEETGSDGNTGMKSAFFRYFIADLAKPYGYEARDIFKYSKCLSADVNVAFDPAFPDVLEKRNSAYLNYGVVVTKYTGSRGKAGTSDASAELVGEIRNLLDKSGIIWQTGQLGKVDMGGGGTVAMHLANLDIDVIDVGVPVLSMHSPYELTAKIDIFMAYRAFCEFIK